MYYLVQQNLFRESNYNILMELFERHKMDYEIITYRPFSDEIKYNTDRKDIFVFGSVAMTAASMKYGWSPGVFYNENHDMEIYMNHYGDYMLNSDGICVNYADPISENLPYTFFARPTKDTKVFSGSL